MLKKFKALPLQTKITIIITGLLILSLLIFSIWFYFLRSAPKILSIINLNTFPVHIKVNGQKIDLDIFDTYNTDLHYRNDVNIEVFKEDNTLVKEIKTENLTSNSQIIEIILSEQNSYCYFSANLSNFYQSNEGEINNLNILTSEASDKFIAEINPNTFTYVYPGKIVSKEEITNVSKNILAVLPIQCSKIKDNNEIVNTVRVFKDFDSKKQREFYENKLKEIEGTEDISTLQNLL